METCAELVDVIAGVDPLPPSPRYALLDVVYDGTARMRDVHTYGVAPGSGAMVKFRIPEAGVDGLADHDRLAYIPYGMVLSFDATGEPGGDAAHESSAE